MKRYIHDPGDRPTNPTTWHSRPACSGLPLSAIDETNAAEVRFFAHLTKCKICDRRDRKEKAS